MEKALEIIAIIVLLVFGFILNYLNKNVKLTSKITEYIALAEEMYKDTTKSGGKKFEFVVDKLYELIPAPYRIILPRTMVETLVQNTFDYIEKYATMQLDKATKTESQE